LTIVFPDDIFMSIKYGKNTILWQVQKLWWRAWTIGRSFTESRVRWKPALTQ